MGVIEEDTTINSDFLGLSTPPAFFYPLHKGHIFPATDLPRWTQRQHPCLPQNQSLSLRPLHTTSNSYSTLCLTSTLHNPVPPNVLPTQLSQSSPLAPSNSLDLPAPLPPQPNACRAATPACRLHLRPPQHQCDAVMQIPWLNLGPSDPLLHLNLSALSICFDSTLLQLRLSPPPLRLHRVPPSLQFLFGPHSLVSPHFARPSPASGIA